MKRLKVVHLIGAMDLGGAQKLTRLTIEGLDSNAFEASVCCIKSGGFYAQQLIDKGYRVHELLSVHQYTPISLGMIFKTAWRLFRLLRRERPDILHTHLFSPSLLGRVIGKLAGVRCIVVSLHRIESPKIQPWIERLFIPLTAIYTTDSNAAAQKLSNDLRLPPQRIRVIYNGIDKDEFASPPDREWARALLDIGNEAFVIGVIAHLYEEKGHAFLLKSLAMIQDKISNLKLLIVGDGYLRDKLERQALQSFPAGTVVFLGQRGDLATLLGAMDLFVLPSSWEGFGIILAEAMYMRVPVITTKDGGGCTEVVEENDGGLLIPYGDTVALGNAISRFFCDQAFRRDQGLRGRARVERLFSPEAMNSQYASIYAEFGRP